MKTVYPLLTLLSASLVVGAPAPFVVPGDVAAIAESVGSATRNLGRREDAIVADFAERALQLRGAIVAARNNQKDDAAAAADAAQGQDAAADEGQAKGKGKEADAEAGEFAYDGLNRVLRWSWIQANDTCSRPSSSSS
jgi:hypothetical protein